MRRSFFMLMVLSSLSSIPAYAEDVQVDSSIGSATVYNDRATLTRTAKVEIPAGAHNLVFTGLPVSLYPDSLRTEGVSSANVTFGALTHKRENFQDYVVPREKELNAQLETLQDERKLLDAEKRALQAGQEFIRNIGKQAALRSDEEVAELNLNPEEWAAAADGISSKLMESMKGEHAVEMKIREANEKIQKVQRELNELRTGQKQAYSVTIPYESDKDTTLTIDLSYQLPGVSWQPIYDARLDMKTGEMDLIQYGSVWQNTGEDWKDIELTLSTAQPSRGTSLPDLSTQWVSLYEQHAARSKNSYARMEASVTGMAAAPMAMDMGEAMEMEEGVALKKEILHKAGFQTAQIATDGFVGEYKITGPATVKSDGTQAKLLIGAFETENWRQVQVKPQYSTEAFLVVKTKLKGEAPVLPGQVNLFRDGAFIGKTYLPMLRPDDVEELAFGIDDNVTVKRNTLKDKSSESGIISKESSLERNFVTEIQNLHKEPVEIAVLETVPVSQDEQITVEILKDKTTSGYEADLKDVKGVTRWTKQLAPQEKAKVTLGWRVTWPKDKNISGL